MKEYKGWILGSYDRFNFFHYLGSFLQACTAVLKKQN